MNAKGELYQYIGELRKQCATLCYGRNIDDFCDNNDITLYLRPFNSNGFCGAAFIGEKQDTIVLNSCRNKLEMFFDFIHEFIHITRHRDIGDNKFTCFDKKQNSFIEWEANEGAAEFLMNYKLFIPSFCTLYDVYINHYDLWIKTYGNVTPIQKLAEDFAVTEMMIINRIRNLSYETDQYKKIGNVDKIVVCSNAECKRLGIIATDYVENIQLAEAKHYFEVFDKISTLRL